jgi:methionyl-tRNA formyltransferase
MLKIATADGYVHVHELQLQGRKRMDTVAFLNGYALEEGANKVIILE